MLLRLVSCVPYHFSLPFSACTACLTLAAAGPKKADYKKKVSVGLGPVRSAGLSARRAKLSRFCGEIRFSSWRAPFELRKALPYVSKRAASFEHSVVGAIWTADRVLPEFGLLHARVVWEKPRAHQGCLGDALCTPRVA